jgi:hypothetical protein
MHPDEVRYRICIFTVCAKLDGLSGEVVVSSDGAKTAFPLDSKSDPSMYCDLPVLNSLAHSFNAFQI